MGWRAQRVLWRCSKEEKRLAEGKTALEAYVLPLFSARLPAGLAVATGAGVSLDGRFLRLFARVTEAKGQEARQAAAAAAQAIGALLGCETELLAGTNAHVAPPPSVKAEATSIKEEME